MSAAMQTSLISDSVSAYSDLELGQFRGQGKFWFGKKFKDRFFIG